MNEFLLLIMMAFSFSAVTYSTRSRMMQTTIVKKYFNDDREAVRHMKMWSIGSCFTENGKCILLFTVVFIIGILISIYYLKWWSILMIAGSIVLAFIITSILKRNIQSSSIIIVPVLFVYLMVFAK
jgi:hypothetical protein